MAAYGNFHPLRVLSSQLVRFAEIGRLGSVHRKCRLIWLFMRNYLMCLILLGGIGPEICISSTPTKASEIESFTLS
jgi:hypothetical protein